MLSPTPYAPLNPPTAGWLAAADKRTCNWCFQRGNCMVAHKAELRGAAAGADAFVRPRGDRGGNLDRIQLELADKYQRATEHMTAEGG